MSRMPLRRLVAAFWCLLFATAPADADDHNFVIATMREKWTGLAGVASIGGEQIKLPDLLWDIKPAAKPEGDPLIPTPVVPFINRLYPINERLTKFEVADPVALRIRGKAIKFESTGSRSKIIPGEYDGFYLAYSLKDTELFLELRQTPSQETEWKIVDAERAMSKSSGEYQYRITQLVRFRLEAAHRPGLFLYLDEDRRLCLSGEPLRKRTIDLDIEKRYDDHSDGK